MQTSVFLAKCREEVKSPLSQDDYEMLLQCVSELHSFRDLNSLRSWLLDTALPKLVPSDWLSYNEVDLKNPENTQAILKPDAGAFQKYFPRFKEVAYQHPLIIGQMQSANFPVHKISDFLTDQNYHKLDLYQDVYGPMGVEYQISAPIKLDPDRVTALALSRRLSDYTERDRTILQMLQPHLVVAFNNLILATERKTQLEENVLALNQLASATIIVDLQGRILYHTGSGLEWIEASDSGILPASIFDWLNRNILTGSSQPTLNLSSPAGTIHVRALPTASQHRLLLVLTRADKKYSSPATRPDPALTGRQRDVAHWICHGKTNAEIAVILGISPRTVQKHVEHIFEKLGVQSRVALIVFFNGKGSQSSTNGGLQ